MGYKVYPYDAAELCGTGYQVKIDGNDAELHKAYVSAHPINRRWPGHQRPKSQAEETAFLSFSMDGSVEISVKPQYAFQSVVIRPKSKNISYKVENGEVRIMLCEPAYFTVEFDDQHHALHVFADEEKIYDADKNASDALYYGPGFHDAGMITLRSNQTLFIDEGAVVYGSIYADGAENIRIIGRGILDNSKNKEVILQEVETGDGSMDVGNSLREHTVRLHWCKNILIEGITIRDSLVYNICPRCCEDIVIRDVKIIGCWRYNSDGIDMHNCKNVLIENCFIRTFDDCICVKGFDWTQNPEEMTRDGVTADTFENVLVRKCVLWNDWGKCLEIGAETRAEKIRDIRFEDCDLIHLCGPALDVMNVDWAEIYNVQFENIRIENENGQEAHFTQQTDEDEYPKDLEKIWDPLVINVRITKHPEYSSGGDRRGFIHHVSFKDIFVTSRNSMRIRLSGFDEEHQVHDVSFEKIFLNGEEMRDVRAFVFDADEFVHSVHYSGKAVK